MYKHHKEYHAYLDDKTLSIYAWRKTCQWQFLQLSWQILVEYHFITMYGDHKRHGGNWKTHSEFHMWAPLSIPFKFNQFQFLFQFILIQFSLQFLL